MMSLDNLNEFSIENVSVNFNKIFQLMVLIVGLAQFLLLHILNERKRIYNFFLDFQAAVRSHLISPDDSRDDKVPKLDSKNFDESKKEKRQDHQSLCRGDMEVVLKSLGMFQETGKLPARLDADDIFNLFEERNPSLDEVKEAFEVFDGNKDGFIDVKEMQNVLRALGLREGLDVEKCRRMIGLADENGDGRIDFEEFVKFMEASLC